MLPLGPMRVAANDMGRERRTPRLFEQRVRHGAGLSLLVLVAADSNVPTAMQQESQQCGLCFHLEIKTELCCREGEALNNNTRIDGLFHRKKTGENADLGHGALADRSAAGLPN